MTPHLAEVAATLLRDSFCFRDDPPATPLVFVWKAKSISTESCSDVRDPRMRRLNAQRLHLRPVPWRSRRELPRSFRACRYGLSSLLATERERALVESFSRCAGERDRDADRSRERQLGE